MSVYEAVHSSSDTSASPIAGNGNGNGGGQGEGHTASTSVQYRRAKTYALQSTAASVWSMSLSPSEDILACSTSAHQMWCVSLSAADGMKPEEVKFEVRSQLN